MSTMNTFTHKISSLYVAYAPEFDVSAYGVCRDDALNNLADEIRNRQATKEKTAYERK
jgi:hypothetical protein